MDLRAEVKQKNSEMKQFSVLVRVPETYKREQARSIDPEWDNLIKHWKAQNNYIISFAFPGESYTVSGSERSIKQETVLSGNLKVVSNIVLQAETIMEALELAKACPILAHGGKVEVREIPKAIRVVEQVANN